MDLVHSTGKKRKNTGGILSIFACTIRQIGGAGGGKAFNQRFLSKAKRKSAAKHKLKQMFVAGGCFVWYTFTNERRCNARDKTVKEAFWFISIHGDRAVRGCWRAGTWN
jgi:hypothetical protein